LKYKVYRSDTGNIDTPANAEAHGTVVQDWKENIDILIISSGLAESTGYYINVIVMDKAGNMAAYQQINATTLTGKIYMFSAVQETGMPGAGGRAGADAMCGSSHISNFASLDCSSIRAFISVSDSDEIRDMPLNYGIPTYRPVMSPLGIVISNDWADLLDGTIDVLLNSGTGIVTGQWWSGSDMYGAVISDASCNGWTDASNTANGQVGTQSSTDGTWISFNKINCNTQRFYLCLCW
jgi:hypothetical protein